MASKKKRIARKENPSKRRSPTSIENPDSFMDRHPAWRFATADYAHERWGVDFSAIQDSIWEALCSYERMTWSEVMKASGARTHGTNNHFVGIDKLCKEARDRLGQLNIQVDQLFSLRINGKIRLFGLLQEDGVFRLLWIDLLHEICPSEKKHT